MNEQEMERLFRAGRDVVQRDGLLLDERRWDEWLDQYLSDCVFWVPMWNDENTINDNTDNGLSHFFYESRKGLEDRVVRIVSGKSPASSPLPRTAIWRLRNSAPVWVCVSGTSRRRLFRSTTFDTQSP